VEDVDGAPAALGAGAERFRLWRRVSWTPGAEGAPRVAAVVLVVAVVGVMRRDLGGVSLGGVLVVVVRVRYHDVWFVVARRQPVCGGLFLAAMRF
jgi:hypothetical protein